MGFGKLLISAFFLILIVAFFSARGKISDLSEKTNELKTAVQQTAEALSEWKDSVFDPPAVAVQIAPIPSPTEEPTPEQAQTAEAPFSCILRTSNGKIGIFTTDGYLIRTLEVDLRTLPESDRSALEAGIWVSSRAELLERLEDFGE